MVKRIIVTIECAMKWNFKHGIITYIDIEKYRSWIYGMTVIIHDKITSYLLI